MANAAIFNALMRPVRSVDDHLAAYDERDFRKSQMQQNALAAMENAQIRKLQMEELRTKQQAALLQRQQEQQRQNTRGGYLNSIDPSAGPAMEFNPIAAARAGFDPKEVEFFANAGNLGKPKVARTIEVAGPNGLPQTVLLDEQGRPVGNPFSKPVEMRMQDLGGTVQAVNPFALTNGQALTKTQSPDSRASVGAQYANAAATRAVAEATRDAAKITARAKDETDLRKEFADLPEVKKYKNAIPAYQAVVKAAQTNNPQADINLIYGLAKLYDPDSVVREGEYDTIANSQSIPEWLKGQAQRLAGGGKLTAETKRQIIEQASIRLQGYASEVEGARRGYGQIATGRGLDSANVFPPVGEQVKPGSGLTEAEKAELEQLRKQLGRK